MSAYDLIFWQLLYHILKIVIIGLENDHSFWYDFSIDDFWTLWVSWLAFSCRFWLYRK